MKKGKKILFTVFLFLILVGIAGVLFYFGFYYSKISKKEYAFDLVVDQVFDKGENIFSLSPEYLMGDTFEVEGVLKVDLSSEEYTNKEKEDAEILKKNNLLKSLSNMDTTYMFQHDLKNQKAYFTLNEKIGEEELFSGKYLISNSTEYYFVNRILKNYVNAGGNNYFESFTEETTTVDNITYLYHFMRDSIKNQIGEDDLVGDNTETLIGNETEKVGRISYRVTDKSYKKLLKGVLKDLKSDSRASQILQLMYPKLDEVKVNDKTKYLDKNESYTFYVYTSKVDYHPLKVELLHINGDYRESYTYEGDFHSGVFYYTENNEAKYNATIRGTSKKMDIVVYDRFQRQIGSIKEQKDKNNLLFTLTLALEDHKYDITYSSKNKDKKSGEYTKEDVLTFKIMNEKVTHLEGTIELVSKVRNVTKVDEDTASSVLKSTLSEDEKAKLDGLEESIRSKLEK